MAIAINGSGTITGISAGGLPDNTVDNGTMADNAIDSAEIANGAVDLAHLSATGTASSSTYLRGDNSWTTVSSVGGATGADFNDSIKARFGTGNDLEIYHDGSNSVIRHGGDGDLFIESITGTRDTYLRGSRSVFIQSNANENHAKFIQNGATELYYDNSKKFETTSAGGTLTGTWNVGKILQVVSCPKTDHATHTTDDTWNNITGVDQDNSGSVWCCKITPSSNSSKILVLYDIAMSMDGHGNVYHGVRLMRDSTSIQQGINSRVGRATKEGTGSRDRMSCLAGSYVDSPSSTSELTYKLQTYHHNHAISINLSDNDSTGDSSLSAASNITLMEVSG